MDDFDIDEIFDRSQHGTNWLLPAFDQQDAIYLSSSRQMLEPIMEETSEDEESSSHSYNQYENGAWSSESETGSVIRIELTNDQDSISERGLACPAKRARHDLDLNLLLNSSSSSSLSSPSSIQPSAIHQDLFHNQQQSQSSQLQKPQSVSSSSVTTNSTITTNNNNFNTNFSQLSTSTNTLLLAPLPTQQQSSALTTNCNNNNNPYYSYTINGLIDSPQNIRKFNQSRNNTITNNNNDAISAGISSLLDSPIADLPIFRKRFDDFNIYSDSDSLSYNSLSRSSSLIQFESLERQLQNDLSNSSSVGSSPSLLSFDAASMENPNNNQTLNYRGSNSSLKRFESSDSRLHQTYYDLDKIDFDKNTPSTLLFRTSRALSEERQSKSDSESSSDNSILSHEERILVRPNNSLTQTPTHSSCLDSISTTRRNSSVSGSSRTKSSAENLSEDSGYCEHYQPLRTKSKSIPSFEKFCEEDEFENHKSLENIRYNPLQSRRSSNSSSTTGSDDERSKHSTQMINESNAIITQNENSNNCNNSSSNNNNNKKQYNIKDKNNKINSSKSITTTVTTTTSSKFSFSPPSPISSTSSTSPVSSNCSSDEDYCTQSIITLKVPTTTTTTTTTKIKYQQNANDVANFANNAIINNSNNNNKKNHIRNKNIHHNDNFNHDNVNTLAPIHLKSTQSTQMQQYACPEQKSTSQQQKPTTYSAIRNNNNNMNRPYSTLTSSQITSPQILLYSDETATASTYNTNNNNKNNNNTTNTATMNSYFPTNSSSLPDVRVECSSYIKEEKEQQRSNKYPNNNLIQNRTNISATSRSQQQQQQQPQKQNNSNKNYYNNNFINPSGVTDSDIEDNRIKINVSSSGNYRVTNREPPKSSIATQNKIFRIDCISPEPEIIVDYDTIIVSYDKPTNSSKFLYDQNSYRKSLSSDQLDRCTSSSNEFKKGNENSLIDDKYLTETSSVPKDLNLLGSDIVDTHKTNNNSKYSQNYYDNDNCHNQITAIKKLHQQEEKQQQQQSPTIPTNKNNKTQFYLHHQSSSGYESFTNCSQDSNCNTNNNNSSISSDKDNFDASDFSFNWNDTTVIKRGNTNNNSANEKRAQFASSNNSNNNSGGSNTSITLRNKNKQQQRYSGEFYNFTNSSSSFTSGLNYMNASYQDLRLLDYTGRNRNSNPNMDNSNLKRSSREIIPEKRLSVNSTDSEISRGNYLLDEISENFDKNLSILSDRQEDSDQLKLFLDSERSASIEKPSPPVRISKLNKENPQSPPTADGDTNRPPIKKPPRRHLKQSQQKSIQYQQQLQQLEQQKIPKTFDIDTSIMKTSYAESLERCNFDPKEISTQDLTEAINRSRNSPVHSTPIKNRGFVASTPNLHTFKVDKIQDDFDDIKISSASNSMQRLPQDKKLGILIPSGSKQSLGKSVNFCPVVAEYSWRDRSNSSSYEPDSLEEVSNDPILLANTVANEKYNINAVTNTFDVVDATTIPAHNNATQQNNNKRILRETNFEWNGKPTTKTTPTTTSIITATAGDYYQNHIEKPQKVIATIINNKNTTSSNYNYTTATQSNTIIPTQTMITTNNTTTATTATTTVVDDHQQNNILLHDQNKFSERTNANETSCNYNVVSGDILKNNKQNNGNGKNTVILCQQNNNKNLIDTTSDFGEINSCSIDNKNLQQQQDIKLNLNNSENQNLIKMEQQNNNIEINLMNIPSQNGIQKNNNENNIKNITKSVIKSEKILNNNINNNINLNNSTATTNGTTKSNNNSKTIVTTVTTTKVSSSGGGGGVGTGTPNKNKVTTVKTYSSASNLLSQQQQQQPSSPSPGAGRKPEYTQNPLLSTTVPLNTANNNELLQSKLKGSKSTADEKNKSFLSRFAGNFRFSLRRKPKKTLPNEPMPTSVTEQAKNHRNLFGGSSNKKKSIADGAVKSKSNQKSATSSVSVTKGGNTVNGNGRESSPDFIYIPLKGPIPTQQQQQYNQLIDEQQHHNGDLNISSGNPITDNNIELNGHIENNHMLSQVTGKPPLPKQPPRIIGDKNKNGNNMIGVEDKLLSTMNKRASTHNAHDNSEFNNTKREIRSQSQPRESNKSNIAGNIVDKFLDNERYFYSSDYQLNETMNGNGSLSSNNNKNQINNSKMHYGGGGGDANGGGSLIQNGQKIITDYVPPPTQFTDEKPPSGKIRKSSGSGIPPITPGTGTGKNHNNNNGSSTNNKNKIGLIETNLDTHETVISGKTQSLMELGPNHSTRNYNNKNHQNIILRQQNDRIDDDDDNNHHIHDDDDDEIVDGRNHHHHHHHSGIRRPHKSMEFLLDKENQKNAAVSDKKILN